jgi:hypothetical protein
MSNRDHQPQRHLLAYLNAPHRDRRMAGKRIQLRLMAFLIFSSSPVVALAAKIDVVSLGPNKPSLVTIDGRIELHDKDQFLQKISKLTRAIVAFNSDGGNLFAGIQIGDND